MTFTPPANICFFCDNVILDLSQVTLTTRGSLVCGPCRADMEAHIEARFAADCAHDAACARIPLPPTTSSTESAPPFAA